MKFFLFSLLFLTSYALAGIEAEVGAYSNFIWRGTTFTENKPALQAELDAEESHGFFVNGFFSNAEFSDEALGKDSEVTSEIDGGIGKRFYISDLSIQAAYYLYTFPGASVFDTDDLNLQLEWKNFLLELSYMDDFFGYRGAYRYIRFGYTHELTNGLSLGAFLGWNDFENPKGEIKYRCLDSACNEIAETLNGAANKNYFDLYLVGAKVLDNNQKIELGFNITNRKEYLVEDGEISTDDAKDFSAVVAWSVPISILP